MSQKVRVIITGSTGMVGEGVLLECLDHTDIDSVLVVNRKPCGISHPKLEELIVTDFFDLTPVEEEFRGYNACFFCAGVSSVGMKEQDYKRITYDLTLHFAATLNKINPGMTFCYVSGSGTDSSEKGRIMWARVKGKTENDLMKLTGMKVFAFRPAFMKPVQGQKNALSFYKYVLWLYPPFHFLFPGYFGTLSDVGQAMISCAVSGYEKKILETGDIVLIAHRTAKTGNSY